MKKLSFIARISAVVVLFGLIPVLSGCGGPREGDTNVERFTLANGMEIILKENHASPMITSLVFVKAGSKFENKYNNGVTHLLEHLLFDGTVNQTQEELDQGIERLGGYLNAFTRKDFTAYIVLLPKEFIEYGLATQADMLFNSTIPEGKLPKERKVVIEEIKMGNDQETAPVESFFEGKAFSGTPYERPIIGYESIIDNIPREAVVDYYKSFYAPNNMMALLIGDFDPAEMKLKLEKVFGKFPKVDLPEQPALEYGDISGRSVYKTPADTRSAYINFSIEAPAYTDPAYYSYTLLADYLGDRDNSPLAAVLRQGDKPLASRFSAGLDTREEFTRLNIEIVSERTGLVDSIVTLTDLVLDGLSAVPPSEQLLEAYKVSRRTEEIYLSEKLHYYGFMKAPLLAVTGWDFFSTLQDSIDAVKLTDFTSAARDRLASADYIVTAVYPAIGKAADSVYTSEGPGKSEVRKHFENMKYDEHDLSQGMALEFPTTGVPEETESKHASYLKETFENGLSVVIKSNPDSRVFALNVLGENRSAMEPEGMAGITDFVNRMIERGTVNKSAEELSEALTAIGAQVTLYDNPWIPYDDRYTTRRYSFMKFETIDEFIEPGIALFSEMITRPAFDPEEVEKIRQEIFGLLGRNSASTYKSARDEFYASLFEGTAYAKSIDGTYRTIGGITAEDLSEYHREFYSPENMIITVGTNESPEKVMRLLKEAFGGLEKSGDEPVEPEIPKDVRNVVKAHERMEKEQVYIYLGHLLPSIHDPDASALKVAGAVLSNRLFEKLREKDGLAYSVGASVNLDKHVGWLMCSIGTGTGNYEKARDGILEEIDDLKKNPPSEDELEMAVNGIWGSFLTANLSRINQAYYMGVYEYLGLGYNYGEQYIKDIRAVTPDQVRETAEKYFDTKNYVIATAGTI